MVLIYAVMLTALLCISIIDVKERRISTNALLILLLGGIAAIILNQDLSAINGIGAMLLVFIVLWLINRLSKGSLGMGDAKLCAVEALYLGIDKAFAMLTLSMILCGVAAAILIIVDKHKRNMSLPFAPFVAAGTLLTLIL